MFANKAGAESETHSTVKVHHARQVVDQVTLLRERVKRQEQAIEMIIAERNQVMECCEKQKEVIECLQQKIQSQHKVMQSVSGDDADAVKRANAVRGNDFGRPGKTTIRVNSMRDALLRIGGVEVVSDNVDDHKDGDAFDASEFQPIIDERGTLRMIRLTLKSQFDKLAALVGFRRAGSLQT